MSQVAAAAGAADAPAALRAELRHAVARRQFALLWQPRLDARSLQVVGADALLRWSHPRHGDIDPSRWRPLAEAEAMDHDIDDWAVGQACRQAGLWRAAGLPLRLTIAVPARQLVRADFAPRLAAALRAHRVAPRQVAVAVDETLLGADASALAPGVAALRAAGLPLAVAGFRGDASLARLCRLAASTLTLDAALVRESATGAAAREAASVAIRVGRALAMRVAAAGVASAAQRDWLVAAGCDELQGPLFARPMSASALDLWLRPAAGSGAPARRPGTVPVESGA
jgi:EAL domain-containing protein (putative c-di-GMP-specific phosphodiesterase class I)